MKMLDPREVRWLVVHTAAHLGNASVEDIRGWHRQRGWEDIGYHWVIRKNGHLETGRSLEYQGAHAYGINGKSIGVCCSGHGDAEPFTDPQIATLVGLAVACHRSYKIEPGGLIGHRELNALIGDGLLAAKYATDKSCPGRKVRMPGLRKRFVDSLYPPPDPLEIVPAA